MPRLRRQVEAEYETALAKANGVVENVDHEYDPQRPWNYLFQRLLEDREWWRDELENNAVILISTKATTQDFLGGDARIGAQAPAATPPGVEPRVPVLEDYRGAAGGARVAGPRRFGGGTPPPPYNPYGGERPAKKVKVHNVQNGLYITTRTGRLICVAHNAGTCPNTLAGASCATNLDQAHVCNKCLAANHNGTACSAVAPDEPPFNVQNQWAGKGAAAQWQFGGQKGGGKGAGKGYGKGFGRGKGGKGGKGGGKGYRWNAWPY